MVEYNKKIKWARIGAIIRRLKVPRSLAIKMEENPKRMYELYDLWKAEQNWLNKNRRARYKRMRETEEEERRKWARYQRKSLLNLIRKKREEALNRRLKISKDPKEKQRISEHLFAIRNDLDKGYYLWDGKEKQTIFWDKDKHCLVKIKD